MIDSRTPPSSAPSNRSKSHILTALPMLTIGLIFIVMAFVTLPTRTDGLSGGPVGVGVSRSLLTEMPPEPAEIPFPGPSTKRPSRAIDADYQLTLQAGTPRHSAVVSELLVESGSAAPPPPAHWTYNNPKTGPYNWQNLDPNYAVCAAGRRQSPIDLKVPVAQHPELNHQVGAVQVDPNLKHILFNYQMSNLTLVRHDNVTHTDEMINNGHTIQVNYETGSKIFVEGRPYDLMQFHFHSPSEHTLNSHHFDMELHLVHRNPEDGLLVVIGVWLEVPHGVVSMIRDLKGPYINVNELTEEEEEDGEESSKDLNNLLNHGKNTFLESLNWNRMPKTPSQEFLHNESEELNIFDILPFDQGYITYEGSLTTPPCSEIVTWYVFKNPITCSILQKNRFQSIFGQNARPTQLIHSRNITQTMDMDHSQNNTHTHTHIASMYTSFAMRTLDTLSHLLNSICSFPLVFFF